MERHAHPTDGRSIIVVITRAGFEQQQAGWQQHQDEVAAAFADLSVTDQRRLLDISRKLTHAFRQRVAERTTAAVPAQASVDGMIMRRNRRIRAS